MAGYSGTPLARKLGMREGSLIHVIGAPATYERLVAPLPEGVRLAPRLTRDVGLVHLFTSDRRVLARQLAALRRRMAPDTVVWVSWPKRTSGVASSVTEDVVREVALPLDYVDVKVCAVNDVWSALKLVIRREKRAPADKR